jgi:hypothetical protein
MGPNQRKDKEVTFDEASGAVFSRADLLDLGCYVADNVT